MSQINHYVCGCGYELNAWRGPDYLGTNYHRVLQCRKCGEYQVVCEDWSPVQDRLRPVEDYSCDSCGAKGEMEEITNEQLEKGLTCPLCGKRMQATGGMLTD